MGFTMDCGGFGAGTVEQVSKGEEGCGAPPCPNGTLPRTVLVERLDHFVVRSGNRATQEEIVTDSDCLFCKIVDGSIPAELVARSERALAFRDINPQAPVHVLVIPTEHLASVGAAEDEHRDLLGDVLLLARDVAHSEGVAEGGFRVVLNTGDDGGQSVHHVHAHVLGGRRFSWPPG